MGDDHIKKSLEDGNDQSTKMCILNVIAPGLGIPPNIFDSNEGIWEGYVHVSSEHIAQFSKNIVYQRRKGMKSAVAFAFDEMIKKHEVLMDKQRASYDTKLNDQSKRIKELEDQLLAEKEIHTKQMEALDELHLADTEECDKAHYDFVEKMVKSHRKEITALKDEMKSMQAMHARVLDIYVDASCDTLEMLQGKK